MNLLTSAIHEALLKNTRARLHANALGHPEPDPAPVVRFFNPVGSGTWLATEIDEDGILFGLADLGFGCPELGSFSLRELQSVRLPFGLGIERDMLFESAVPLSTYARLARRTGSILLAEIEIHRRASVPSLGDVEQPPDA
jgi:hypothetical protein